MTCTVTVQHSHPTEYVPWSYFVQTVHFDISLCLANLEWWAVKFSYLARINLNIYCPFIYRSLECIWLLFQVNLNVFFSAIHHHYQWGNLGSCIRLEVTGAACVQLQHPLWLSPHSWAQVSIPLVPFICSSSAVTSITRLVQSSLPLENGFSHLRDGPKAHTPLPNARFLRCNISRIPHPSLLSVCQFIHPATLSENWSMICIWLVSCFEMRGPFLEQPIGSLVFPFCRRVLALSSVKFAHF